MAGRPRKNTLIGEPEQLDAINKDISYETRDLHQMFRVIARGMPQGGSQLISEVDYCKGHCLVEKRIQITAKFYVGNSP